MIKKIYLAGPFFNPEQIKVQAYIEGLCRRLELPFFSPRLECLCPPDATPAQRTKTFQMNVKHIENASFVLARIDDYDPGTIWELGCAFAFRVPAFAYTTVSGRGLNLMLSESGLKLVAWDKLANFLCGNKRTAVSWKGDIQ
jgi:nucleoside deoxyribosyltransferase